MFIAACGGGGGGGSSGSGSETPATAVAPTTISGTAAAGAPIVGSVTLKDSSVPPKLVTQAIAADGSYSVEAKDMKAPFMLRADGIVGGRNYSLFSAATSADVGGRINITPLTDLIVANIAGQIAETVYDSGNFSGLTGSALASAETTLKARLQPVLAAVGVGASVDLLRATFNADKTGLDAVLDAIRVTQDPVTLKATIKNIIDNQEIEDDLASPADNTVLAQTNVAAGVSDLQQITAVLEKFATFWATSLPSESNANLRALFSSDFNFDGENLDAFLSDIAQDPLLVGMKLENVALKDGSLTPSAASVDFILKWGEGHTDLLTMVMKKDAGAWKMSGNGRIADVEVSAHARYHVNSTLGFGGPQMDSGLQVQIKEPGLKARYAIVTGPGLPPEGALFVRVSNQASFKAAAGAAYMGMDAATPSLNNFGHNQYPLTDGQIASIPAKNAEYQIKLMDDADTPNTMADDKEVATYKSVLLKAPMLNADLNAGLFATITSPSAAAISAFAVTGGDLSVNWTLPAGTGSDGVHFFRSGSGIFDTADSDTATTQTSAKLTMTAATATVSGSGINLFVRDAFRRDFVTILQGR